MGLTVNYPGVKVIEKSSNSKIGDCSATMVSQYSCPSSCAFKGSGCYAESGMQALHTRRLNLTGEDPRNSIEQLAKYEAEGILKLSGKRPLRLHVVGDCTTDNCAKIVSDACDTYKKKHEQKVWTYTHAWRDVNRESWGNVSILASCESIDDIKEASEKGYATCIVEIDNHGKTRTQDGFKILPCPQQLGTALSCEQCKLCMKDSTLKDKKIVISFNAHSQGKKKIQNKLVTINKLEPNIS